MQKIPTILIQYNRFLDPVFTAYVQSHPKWKDIVVPTEEEVHARVAGYKEVWGAVSEKILAGMCDILELSFTREVLDVYIVSLNPRPFSNPIVIKSGFTPEEFVSVLTHELIHRLFTLNIETVHKDIFTDLFPEESPTTQNHVIVHALSKYVYLDVLAQPTLLEANIARSKAHTTEDYTRAWEIVEKEGYKELLTRFKGAYKK